MKTMMKTPAPGLDGTYRGACVVCLRGTDTGLAFSGEAEWAIAGLMGMGIPQDEASLMVSNSTGCDPGMVPLGEVTVCVRVCQQCANRAVDKNGKGPKVGLLTNDIPNYRPPKGVQ